MRLPDAQGTGALADGGNLQGLSSVRPSRSGRGSPDTRLEEGLAALGRAGGRIAVSRDPRRYLIDFLSMLRRTLQRDGFTVDHIRYFSNVLKPWIASRDALLDTSHSYGNAV